MRQQEQARANQQQAAARQSFPPPQTFSGAGASLEDFIDELT